MKFYYYTRILEQVTCSVILSHSGWDMLKQPSLFGSFDLVKPTGMYMYVRMYVCVCVYIYIYIYTHTHTHIYGSTLWRTWFRYYATSRKVAGSIPDGVLGTRYGPGADSAFNRNEYQEYFLESKGDRCVGLTTLPPSCNNCLEI